MPAVPNADYHNEAAKNEHRFWRKAGLGALFVLIVAVVGGGAFLYMYAPKWAEATISIPEGQSREELADHIGKALLWSADQRSEFEDKLATMQWQTFSDSVRQIMTERYDWKDAEQGFFDQHRVSFIQGEYDLLSTVYESGSYIFESDTTPHVAADMVMDRFLSANNNSFSFAERIEPRLDEDRMEKLALYVQDEVELLPDIVPLPPQDVAIRNQDGRKLLVFSTTYYNKGDGPLELIADPETRDVEGDVERDVLQSINRTDGEARHEIVGTFEWHDTHLHYHFSDFIDYTLMPVEVPKQTDQPVRFQKTTFCVRDVSRIEMKNLTTPDDAQFKICYKDRQGVSVGWGDTYFHDYPDQNVDVTGLPAGRYRLSFHANPDKRFEEETFENNKSSAIIELDPAAGTVEIRETTPSTFPDVEHIYLEQPMGAGSMQR